MGAKESKIIRSIADSIKRADDRKTYPYDTQATIRRIEGNTAWVHIPGGVDETPVQLTINASEGDTVQVRVSGGRAFLVGNASAPPTDNTYARQVNHTLTQEITNTNTVVKGVQKVVQAVKKIADNTNQYFWHTETGTDTGAHITEIPQEDFLADPENGGGNLLARSNGIAVRDGLEELATFSADGVQIGKDSESHADIDYRSMKLIDKDDNEYFNVSDLRDADGYATITKSFECKAWYAIYVLDYLCATNKPYTVVVLDNNNVDVTQDYPLTVSSDRITFTTTALPSSGYTLTIIYQTTDPAAKKLTFGAAENNDYVFSVSGRGDIDIVGTYNLNGAPLLYTETYDLGAISITPGTPGTASTTISQNVTKTGYTPIAVKIRYVNTSLIGFDAFLSEGAATLYVQIVRRYASAYSPGYHAYADVTFIKS